MKKTVLITACLLTLLLFGSCHARSDNNGEPTKPAAIGSVTFFNGTTEGDVWLLPDTEENRGTTLWGTADAAGVKANESRETPLCEAGDDGHYLFRMIDVDGLYYSADGVTLKPGWTVQITGNELFSYTLLVTNETGALQDTYDVFSAAL